MNNSLYIKRKIYFGDDFEYSLHHSSGNTLPSSTFTSINICSFKCNVYSYLDRQWTLNWISLTRIRVFLAYSSHQSQCVYKKSVFGETTALLLTSVYSWSKDFRPQVWHADICLRFLNWTVLLFWSRVLSPRWWS